MNKLYKFDKKSGDLFTVDLSVNSTEYDDQIRLTLLEALDYKPTIDEAFKLFKDRSNQENVKLHKWQQTLDAQFQDHYAANLKASQNYTNSFVDN
jgi:hypothetical protein